MLIQTKELKGFRLLSLDGEIGKVKEFYFDDNFWTVRYLVANTGSWLTGRKVLISPHSLGQIIPDNENIEVKLTKSQIENSPALDVAKPVSRQFEEAFYGYHRWPTYWSGTYMWGMHPIVLPEDPRWEDIAHEKRTWDPNLRSTHEVVGYDIEGKDGEVGHVSDFLIDTETWAIRYLIVDTKNWWPGKRVLVSPQWIESVNWSEQTVQVNLSRDEIKASVEFNEDTLVNRDFESNLYQHYGRRGYWDTNTAPFR